MANKVSFANLKLKVNTEVNEFDYLDNKFEVLKYLPISDKFDLVNIVLQNSKRKDGYYDPIQLEKYFNLYIVYMYSNINFTDKQKEDEDKLYDLLESNGIINEIISHMEEAEYEDLLEKLNETKESEMSYITTAAAMIRNIIADLPAQADAAMKIVDNFDPEKFQAVKDFAVAANGGRPIPGV